MRRSGDDENVGQAVRPEIKFAQSVSKCWESIAFFVTLIQFACDRARGMACEKLRVMSVPFLAIPAARSSQPLGRVGRPPVSNHDATH